MIRNNVTKQSDLCGTWICFNRNDFNKKCIGGFTDSLFLSTTFSFAGLETLTNGRRAGMVYYNLSEQIALQFNEALWYYTLITN